MELCYANNQNSLFKKYSSLVTWFANTLEGRKLLKIDRKEPIALLLPNGAHYQIGKKKYEAVFYTRAKYAPILYPALELVDYYVMSLKDSRDTKRLFLSALGLLPHHPLTGQQFLLTLTVNPDAHPETTSVDGLIKNDGSGGASFATVRGASAGTTASDTGAEDYQQSDFFFGGEYGIYRGFYLFDTSTLTANATISAAVLSLFRNTATNLINDDSAAVHIVTSSPATNTALVIGDFDQVGSASLASVNLASYAAAEAYQDFNLSDLTTVSKTGVSKYACRGSRDLTNSAPTGVNQVGCYYADESGTSKDPKLVVTYTLAVEAGGSFLLNFV